MGQKNEPRTDADLRTLLLAYLDYYRDEIAAKVANMSEGTANSSILPSEWTPAQLLNHLAFMEQRWFVCAFLGQERDDRWGDWEGKQWAAPASGSTGLIDALRRQGAVTRSIVEGHSLDERAADRGSFTEETAPHLHWVLLHVLQEYARHAGQLDIVRELTDAQ